MIPGSGLLVAYRLAGHGTALLGGFGVWASLQIRDEITLGSLLISAVIIAVAGMFTIRARIANVWREEAEGEKARADRLEAYAEELKSQVVKLEARTDLTAALADIRTMNETAVRSIGDVMATALGKAAESSLERDGRTHALLEEIRDKLPAVRD